MTNFDEAWLRQHQAKIQREKEMRVERRSRGRPRGERSHVPLPPKTPFRMPPDAKPVFLQLSEPFILLNPLLRMHWSDRRLYAAKLSAAISQAWGDAPIPPPVARAWVGIERSSTGTPDTDGLIGGAKPLIDCLLLRSDRHPHGLGFILDDDPAHLTLEVVARQSESRATRGTTIVIRDRDA